MNYTLGTDPGHSSSVFRPNGCWTLCVTASLPKVPSVATLKFVKPMLLWLKCLIGVSSHIYLEFHSPSMIWRVCEPILSNGFKKMYNKICIVRFIHERFFYSG